MQNFIVLGFIPGTEFQINFTDWLICFSGFCLLTAIIFKRHSLRRWMLGHQLLHEINHRQSADLAI